MKEIKEFMQKDRYFFDTGKCSSVNGFAQIDTGQDAWYFGTWANPKTLTIFCYAEGDCLTTICESVDEFVAEIKKLAAWNMDHGWGFAVDAYKTEDSWKKIGLGEFLH